MATDYDAPRVKESDETVDDSLEAIAARGRDKVDVAVLDVDEGDGGDPIILPDVDLSGEELTVRVLPKQPDEFTCSSCFLVQHHSRIALKSGDQTICADCA
jgi:hypothetical protein